MHNLSLIQSVSKWTKTILYFVSFVLLSSSALNAQSNCTLYVTDILQPTSCQATNGQMIINATDQPSNPCERQIKVFSNGIQIASGSGTLTLNNLGSGTYEVFGMNGCGCPTVDTKVITLNGGTPTKLTPQYNKGAGFVQGNKVTACRNSDIKLGVQALGVSSLSIQGPNGFYSDRPDGSSFWNFNNLQPNQSGNYTITYTNAKGCESRATIALTVGALNVDLGPDRNGCFASSYNLVANVTGQSTCKTSCPTTLDSLLVKYTLDQCNASGQANQDDYSEFLPEYPSLGNCTSVTASNVYRDRGEHSCTPVLGSVSSDIGLCTPAQASCDPKDYDPINAVKFEVTINPSQAGRLSKLTFKEQSPLVWVTTYGTSGVNNYNTKFLLRVYKNDFLIYSEDEILTARTWRLETFDFSNNPNFEVTETSTFRFELRGYCITNVNGDMSAWELNDIQIYGGCCTGITTYNTVNYLWSNGATTPSINITPTATTNYGVTITDCNGCSAKDDMNITVFPLPTPTIVGVDEICFGKSAILTASGGILYNWSTGETTDVISVSPTVTTTYIVTVTDANGCTATAQKVLIVNPLPIPEITGDFVICLNESTVLTASGGSTYLWSTGETTVSIQVSPTINTNYSVTVTDNNTCSAHTSVEVIVNPLPTPVITGDLEICIGDETILTVTGANTYLWSTGATTNTINVSPTVNTTYAVTATDLNGCSQNTSVEVIVRPLPVPTVSGNLTICKGSSTILTAGGGVSYEWSTGATTTVITVNSYISQTYTVTVTNEFGCLAQKEVYLNVNPLPNPTITGNEATCLGGDVTLTATGGISFAWSNGANTPSITVTPTETTIYSVTVTDANGCTASVAKSVTVNPIPVVSISAVDEICNGDTTLLTANVLGSTFCAKDCKNELLINYTLDQCQANTVPEKLDFTELIPNFVSSGGLAEITATELYKLRGDHSCTPDGNGGLGFCFPAMISCDLSEVNLQNAARFKVVITPNQKAKINKLTFIEKSPLMWVTADGSTGINDNNNYYLLNVYRDGVLIFSIDQVATEVDWNLETYDFSSNPYFTVESETEFEFELYGYCVNSRGGQPGWELDDIKIYGGECSSSLVQDNTSYVWSNGATTQTISVNPSATSNYAVTITDCNGCQNTTSKTIIVNELPIAVISGNLEICAGETTTLIASGGSSYLWSNGATTSSISVDPVATTTYTVEVTNEKDCTANATATVIVNELPIAVITGDLVICNGSSTNLTASGGVSYVWSNGATTPSITVNPIATTNYSVEVTSDKGCKSTKTVTVTVNDLPIASITGDLEICNGASTTLTASGGISYAWSNGATTSSITVSPSATSTYIVTVTNAPGCTAMAIATVVVNELPIAVISGNLEICAGETTTLIASGGSSYLWSNGATTSSITVTLSATTTYTVEVTNEKGCTANAIATVIVNELPIAVITGDLVICNGSSTNLTASGGVSYLWSNGATTPSITVNPITTTNYSVEVTSDKGCKSTKTVTVTVNDLPIASIIGDLEICNGASTTLSASGGISYAWSNGATTSSITVSPSITATYIVTVTNAPGCIATAIATVVVNELPAAVIGGNLEICAGESTILTASGGNSYLWSNGATTSSITVNPSATTTYTVEITNDKGCKGNATATVIVNELPIAVMTGNLVICSGSSTTLTATGGVSYLWSNGSTSQSITVNPISTTNYSVEVTSDKGCKSTKTVTVTVNDLPIAIITGELEICNGASTTLTASGGSSYTWSNGATTSSITVSPSATTTYIVTVTKTPGCTAMAIATVVVNDLPTAVISGSLEICVGESTILTASGGNSYLWLNGATTSSITVNPSATTTYTVEVTNEKGCIANATATVIVNELPIAVITGDLLICNGSSTNLTASGGVSYLWSNGATTSSITVNPIATTNYSVEVTSDKGCKSTKTVTVTVNDLPIAIITGDLEICNGASTTLSASGGISYAWSNGATTSSITVSPSTTTDYSVTVTADNSCVANATATVIVNELPIVTITGEREICEGDCVVLEATGGEEYEWTSTMSNGYTCEGAFYIGGIQNTEIQSLFTINANGDLTEVTPLSEGRINGVGYYCSGSNEPYLYGMQRMGNTQLDAIRGKLVKVDPRTGAIEKLSEIPLPPNPYGPGGISGIVTYVGEISKDGIYYFPAVSALINPLTFEIIDYTMYLGSIDLKNGNGSNAVYRPMVLLATCKPYIDAFVASFQTYALNPSGREPSGGIQDWAFNEDESMLMSFFGIENALFRMNVSTATTSCIAGPSSNLVYTGTVGVKTDEIGGVYRQGGKLYGHQDDRGRIFEINETSGSLTLVKEGLPLDNRGDSATCRDCGSSTSGPAETAMISVCPKETTTYTVKVTDSKGCMTTASITVVVKEKPVVTIIGDTNICLGESTTLTASGGTSYMWSTGATTSSIVVNPSINTTYSVTVTDGASCSGEGNVLVTVKELPSVTIGGNQEICVGETIRLFAISTGTYQWSNGSTTAFLVENPIVTTTYTVTVTNDAGCSSIATATVIVNGLPIAVIAGNLEICLENSTTLTASGDGVYSWSNGENTASITVSPIVSTDYTVTVTNDNGCIATATVKVIVNELPIAVITGNLEICNGDSTTLTASGGVNYAWSNGATTASITVNPSTTAKYTVEVTNSKGCKSSESVKVIVNELPIAMLIGNLELCAGESSTLTASGGTSYTWSNGETTASITVNPSTTTTYSVTVSNDGNCSAIKSATVVINDLPIAAIKGELNLCNGGTTTLTATGGTSYLWSNGATTASITVNPSTNTSYTVEVTNDKGCTASASATVVINGLPSAIITGNLEICAGTGTTLTAAGGTNYAWSNGATTASITVNPSISTDFAVTVSNDYGCIASATVKVIVNELPITDIAGNNEICQGDQIRILALGAGAYNWSNGETTAFIIDNPVATTTYTVTITSNKGCQSIGRKTVIVNPIPIATITGDTTICIGESTTLTANGGMRYGWANGQTTQSITVSPSTTTKYSVVVSNENDCFSLVEVTVNVYDHPTAAITGDLEICAGENTTLFATGDGDYLWSNGATTSSITVSPSISTDYSVLVTNIHECTDTDTVGVIVSPLPQVTISGDLDICIGESSTLVATGGGEYLWSTGATTSDLTVSPVLTTTYTVTVTNNGCANTASVTVNVNSRPMVVIDGVLEICEGSSTTLTASGGSNYLWSNGATSTSIKVSPSKSTTYTVTVSNSNQCTSMASVFVKVNAKPIITLSGVDKICKGDSTTIVANASSEAVCPGTCIVDAPEVLAYWDLNACTAIMNLGTHFDYSEFTPVINNYNCTQVTASTVYRNVPNKHSCTPGHNGGLGMCIGSQKTCNPSKVDYFESLRFEVNITPNSSSQITGLSFYEKSPAIYVWVDGVSGPNNFATKFLLRVSKDGEVIYYQDAIPTHREWGLVTFDFSDNNNFKSLAAATYFFELVPYCTINNGAVETVWDIDEIKVLGGCCTATTTQITSYAWSNGSTSSSISVSPTTNKSYTVTVTDCAGCTNEAKFDLKVACLVADLGPDLSINLGESVTLRPTITGKSECSSDPSLNGVKYLWSTGETTATIVVEPSSSKFYRVTVTDCNECSDTESISINVRLEGMGIVLYPNPVIDKVQLTSAEDLDPNMTIMIIALDGRSLVNEPLEYRVMSPREAELMLPVDISNGVYILEINSKNKTTRQKVIVSKSR